MGGGLIAGVGGSSTVNGVVYRDGQLGDFTDATDKSVVATAVNGGTLTLTANENIVITGGASDMGFGGAANATISKDSSTLSTVNVKTVTGANDAIARIDSALTAVSSLRSTFGAIQNRFQSTISNLNNTVTNLSAAQSRIQDADYATEVSNMSRAQILQQAGTSVLAQANQVPQSVLSLLR